MSDMYKAIIPLDYLGPEIDLYSTASIRNVTSSGTNLWYAAVTISFSTPYRDDRVVLMDNILLTENSLLNSYNTTDKGELRYVLTLNHGEDRMLSRYCKFQFKFGLGAPSVTTMDVIVTVITPFNARGKILTTTYRNGITTGQVYITPAFYVDWSDTTQVTNYVD